MNGFPIKNQLVAATRLKCVRARPVESAAVRSEQTSIIYNYNSRLPRRTRVFIRFFYRDIIYIRHDIPDVRVGHLDLRSGQGK